MPLKDTVSYSKIITLPSGHQTLGLFNKKHKLIEARVCLPIGNNKFVCPKKSTESTQRHKVAKYIGVDYDTNQPIKKRKK